MVSITTAMVKSMTTSQETVVMPVAQVPKPALAARGLAVPPQRRAHAWTVKSMNKSAVFPVAHRAGRVAEPAPVNNGGRGQNVLPSLTPVPRVRWLRLSAQQAAALSEECVRLPVNGVSPPAVAQVNVCQMRDETRLLWMPAWVRLNCATTNVAGLVTPHRRQMTVHAPPLGKLRRLPAVIADYELEPVCHAFVGLPGQNAAVSQPTPVHQVLKNSRAVVQIVKPEAELAKPTARGQALANAQTAGNVAQATRRGPKPVVAAAANYKRATTVVSGKIQQPAIIRAFATHQTLTPRRKRHVATKR